MKNMNTNMNANMDKGELFVRLQSFLRSKEHTFEANEEEQLLLLRFGGKPGNFTIGLRCEDQPLMLQIITEHPMGVPESRCAVVGAALHRLNSALRAGSFGLDVDDHRIRFRLPYPLQPGADVEDQFGMALAMALCTFESRFHLIGALVCATEEVGKTLAELEPRDPLRGEAARN